VSTSLPASDWLPVALGFLVIFAIFAYLSRSLYSIIVAGVLAVEALFVYLVPSSTPTAVAIAFAVGSILALWLGRHARNYRRAVKRDLTSLEDRLASIASQNTLIDIRKAEVDLLLKQSNATEAHLVPSQGETPAQGQTPARLPPA
jgi:ABC-type multidrug transport system fused ATPase/permease subunit